VSALSGLAVSVLVLLAASPALEKPARYATDKAGVIPAARLDALNESLAAFERETANQVLVYVDRRLPEDTSIEDLAAATYRGWGIGQKDMSNGVLFLVFVDDRAMRIEVGYGLEGAIPDAIAKRITSEVVRPLFKKGDYAGGVEAGARALMAAARGEGFAGTGRTVAETRRAAPPFEPWTLAPPFLAGFVPFVVGLVRRPTTGRSVPGVLAGAAALAALAAAVTAAWTGQPGLWLLAGVLFIATVALFFVAALLRAATRTPAGGSAGSRSAGYSPSYDSSSKSDYSSSSSDSSSSDSSSSSSSDFSGGGGDSGGGGSSDNW
jgi:uncharacterized protein